MTQRFGNKHEENTVVQKNTPLNSQGFELKRGYQFRVVGTTELN